MSAPTFRRSRAASLRWHGFIPFSHCRVGGARKSRGFGTRSVIASIESQLGGQALFDWRAEGLICQLLVPVMRQTETSEPDDRRDVASSNTVFRRVSESAGS